MKFVWWTLFVGIGLAFWLAVIVIAVHFISKYW